MSEMYGPETIWGFPIHGGRPQIIQSRPRCCKCWRQWPSPPPWHQAQRHVGFLGRCNNFWKKRERYIYIILYIYIYTYMIYINGIPRGLVGFRSRLGSDHYAMDQEQRSNLFFKVCAPRLVDAGWLQPPFFGMGLMPRKFCFPQLG